MNSSELVINFDKLQNFYKNNPYFSISNVEYHLMRNCCLSSAWTFRREANKPHNTWEPTCTPCQESTPCPGQGQRHKALLSLPKQKPSMLWRGVLWCHTCRVPDSIATCLIWMLLWAQYVYLSENAGTRLKMQCWFGKHQAASPSFSTPEAKTHSR